MPKGVAKGTGRSARFKDRTGNRNGRLTFIRSLGQDVHRHQVWEAVCDCGELTRTATPHSTRSCGCLQRETIAATQRAKALPHEIRRANILRNRLKQREKRRSDPVKAMHARLSRLHRHALKEVGAIKTSRAFEHLGYTIEQFVSHIERQFNGGMGWHNMADWQIDHIIPISEAKTVDDVIALNQLSNLRPLWAKENNSKKNKRLVLL